MIIGVPAEIKTLERRVVLDPPGVKLLVDGGHRVLIQSGAGTGAGFSDDEYRIVGGEIVPGAAEAWAAEMVVKVKEPQAREFAYFRPDLRLFCYLHLAAEPELTRALLSSGVDGHAFETVVENGRLPLLAPMSEIAGRSATIFGAAHLAQGSGTLLSGAAGVPPARVVVLGLGVAGLAAARSAVGQDAFVTGLDINLDRLREARDQGHVSATLASNSAHIEAALTEADLVIGAALVPGSRAPILVQREHLAAMRPGSVFVDLAIDQGGCAATSRPTTLADPVYTEAGVIHYCVTNVPGQFPRTASRALSAAVGPRVAALARDRTALAGSTNVFGGEVTHPIVRDAVAQFLEKKA